jgi:hypothetical protein
MEPHIPMRTLLCALLLLVCTKGSPQTWKWAKQIGGHGKDWASIQALDSEGNFYLTGAYAPMVFGQYYQGCGFENVALTGRDDGFIAKYSSDGQLLWLRDIPSPGSVSIAPIILDEDNGVFYTLGNFDGSCQLDTITVSAGGTSGVLLSKWTVDGRCLWARNIASSWFVDSSFEGVAGLSLVLDGAGELMIALSTGPYDLNLVEGEVFSSGIYLGKYNSDGQALWWKQFTAFTAGKSIYLFGLKYHAGRIYGFGGATITPVGDTTTVDTIQIVGRQGRGFALVSIDPNTGVADWFRMDGFPQGSVGYQRMGLDGQGDIVVVGSYGGTNSMSIFENDTLSSTTSYSKAFIAKYDSSGSLQYVRGFEGSERFYFSAIDVAPDGSMALTGTFQGQIALGECTFKSITRADIFMAIHDPSGEPQSFMHTGIGSGNSVHFLGTDLLVSGLFPSESTPFGSIVIGEEILTSRGWSDIILARTTLPSCVSPQSARDDQLFIYPNPNTGLGTIVLPASVQPGSDLVLTIHDAMGRMVQQTSLRWNEGTIPLDISTHAKGVYHAELLVGKHRYSATLISE